MPLAAPPRASAVSRLCAHHQLQPGHPLARAPRACTALARLRALPCPHPAAAARQPGHATLTPRVDMLLHAHRTPTSVPVPVPTRASRVRCMPSRHLSPCRSASKPGCIFGSVCWACRVWGSQEVSGGRGGGSATASIQELRGLWGGEGGSDAEGTTGMACC